MPEQDVYSSIKRAAENVGVTLLALSEKLGISRQALNKAMKSPSYPTLVRIAEALDVPMWQLFASPADVASKAPTATLACPNCGTPIKIEVNVK